MPLPMIAQLDFERLPLSCVADELLLHYVLACDKPVTESIFQKKLNLFFSYYLYMDKINAKNINIYLSKMVFFKWMILK